MDQKLEELKEAINNVAEKLATGQNLEKEDMSVLLITSLIEEEING